MTAAVAALAEVTTPSEVARATSVGNEAAVRSSGAGRGAAHAGRHREQRGDARGGMVRGIAPSIVRPGRGWPAAAAASTLSAAGACAACVVSAGPCADAMWM